MSSDSEIAQDFKWLHEQRKKKKQSNLEYSTQKLIDLGIEFESKNGGVHLVVRHNGKTIDYWPSTGKFKDRKSDKYCRGLRKLLKTIGVKQ